MSLCIKCSKEAEYQCAMCNVYICSGCMPKGDPYCPNFRKEASYESVWERIAYFACSLRCILRMKQFEQIRPLNLLEQLYNTPEKVKELIIKLDKQIDGL
jgi:hypothetical protein